VYNLSSKWRKFQLKCRKWKLNKGIFDFGSKEAKWPALCSSHCNSWKTVSPHPLKRRQRGSTNENENGKGENLCRWQELVLSPEPSHSNGWRTSAHIQNRDMKVNVGVNVLLYAATVLQPGTQTCYQLDRSLSKIQNWSGHQKQTGKSLYMPGNKTPVQSVT